MKLFRNICPRRNSAGHRQANSGLLGKPQLTRLYARYDAQSLDYQVTDSVMSEHVPTIPAFTAPPKLYD